VFSATALEKFALIKTQKMCQRSFFLTGFAPNLTQANRGLKRIADYSDGYYRASQSGAG